LFSYSDLLISNIKYLIKIFLEQDLPEEDRRNLRLDISNKLRKITTTCHIYRI